MTPHIPTLPFSHYSGSRSPRLLIVGEAWGQSEHEVGGFPFVGASGQLLFKILGEAIPGVAEEKYAWMMKSQYAREEWLRRREDWLEEVGIGLTNVFNLRPMDNKLENLCYDKKARDEDSEVPSKFRNLTPLVRSPRHGYLQSRYLPELQRLHEEVLLSKPNLLLTFGTGLWALGTGGLSEVRGTTQEISGGTKLLPSYHPAGVMRNWGWRSILVADVIKAWRESGTREWSRPQRFVEINPEIGDIEEWLKGLNTSLEKTVLSCDIETRAGQITSVGFAKSRTEAIVIPFVSVGEICFSSYWRTFSDEAKAWNLCQDILASPNPKLFQNGMYDIQWLLRRGMRIVNVADDTMLLHHAIHPEMRKGLGFLGSVYTDEPAWKIMRKRGKEEGDKAEG